MKVNKPGRAYRIGDLARLTGVSARSLRYYEARGLLEPLRSMNGYREYGDGDVVRVQDVRALMAAGLHIDTIAEILPCMRRDGAALIPECEELADVLLADRERLAVALDSLRTALEALDRIIDRARSTS